MKNKFLSKMLLAVAVAGMAVTSAHAQSTNQYFDLTTNGSSIATAAGSIFAAVALVGLGIVGYRVFKKLIAKI